MIIYLAILHDRHCDDSFKASMSLESAIGQCQEWAKLYTDEEFKEPDWQYKPWSEFYLQSGEEGPTVRVQKIELIE